MFRLVGKVSIVRLFIVAIFFSSITSFGLPITYAQVGNDDINRAYDGLIWAPDGLSGVCTGGAYAAGDNYPIRAPVVNDTEALAMAIDEYIANREPDSPFNGLGSYFVEGGMRAGINPILVVAHAVKESALGTAGSLISLGNNGFGRTAASDQPSFSHNGRNWYKWETVQESLYSKVFPADGTTSQPDDMFQYIARRFNGNLDSGLESYLEGNGTVAGYAPSSDGNDVPKYVADIQQVTSDIVTLAGNAIDLTQVVGAVGSCLQPISGDAISYALLYAWPEYHSPPYPEKKPEYAEAIVAAQAQGEYVGGGQYPGVDCGGFVTRVMRDSGYDTNYNEQQCNTWCQLQYLESNWQSIDVSSTADLLPGDVAIDSEGPGTVGHTFMYVGDQPGFETAVASAAFSTTGQGWRAPMAGVENVLSSRWHWFRNTQ